MKYLAEKLLSKDLELGRYLLSTTWEKVTPTVMTKFHFVGVDILKINLQNDQTIALFKLLRIETIYSQS